MLHAVTCSLYDSPGTLTQTPRETGRARCHTLFKGGRVRWHSTANAATSTGSLPQEFEHGWLKHRIWETCRHWQIQGAHKESVLRILQPALALGLAMLRTMHPLPPPRLLCQPVRPHVQLG
jgi:hypothetical protein